MKGVTLMTLSQEKENDLGRVMLKTMFAVNPCQCTIKQREGSRCNIPTEIYSRAPLPIEIDHMSMHFPATAKIKIFL